MNWTAWDWLHYLLNFALVIGLMVACLWLLKRLQGKKFKLNGGNTQRMRILETLSIGPRQKLLLIAIDDQELVISSTAQHIQTLSAGPARVSERA